MKYRIPTEMLITPGMFLYTGLHFEEDKGLIVGVFGIMFVLIAIFKQNRRKGI